MAQSKWWDNQDQLQKYLRIYFIVGGIFMIGLKIFVLISQVIVGFENIEYLICEQIFNISSGIILLVCGYLLYKRQVAVLGVYFVFAIASRIYAPVMGRGVNIVMLVFSGLVLFALYQLLRRGFFVTEREASSSELR